MTTKPTRAAMRAAKKLHGVENPGPFYGLEGLAHVIDGETGLPAAVEAFRELLDYVGGYDVAQPDHPIAKARAAMRKLTGETHW
jgi:hypothetical protein